MEEIGGHLDVLDSQSIRKEIRSDVKNFIRSVINKTGFDVVRTVNQHGDFRTHLINVLGCKKIDCVIDVGANSGQYGEFLRSLGYEGHIISFEPVLAVYEELANKCEQDSKWSCHQSALGERNETKVINVYSSTLFSSFLKANEYSKNIWHSLKDMSQETVEVFRLDEVFDEFIGRFGCDNHMLKLDTQGYDKFAFEGAKACLENISVLQSELSLIPVYEGMDDVYEILNEFHSQGFYISGMYPINRDESLAVIEYDCVLVRRTQGPS